jgi:ATP-dependent Clp endopeptidase proteolytic subunit ClpP
MTKEIYILDEITAESVATISKQITEAIENNADKIIFKVNSGGGSVISAMGLYDEISNLQVDTECLVFGVCASAATYIALACNHTKIYKSGTFMIHRCHGGVRGTLEEMENDLDYFEEMENKVIALYASKSGKTSEEIIAMMDATTYMNAEQALANGFVDEVVGRDSALFNVADVEILNSIEVEEQPKNLIEKVVDIFTSKEKKEEETLQNKLAATENKVIELTNEIEALKVSHNAAIVELNNIIDNYKQKEQELIESFDNRVADEVNTRIANLGIDTELPDASNEISEIDFSNCKSISDYWKQLGY